MFGYGPGDLELEGGVGWSRLESSGKVVVVAWLGVPELKGYE